MPLPYIKMRLLQGAERRLVSAWFSGISLLQYTVGSVARAKNPIENPKIFLTVYLGQLHRIKCAAHNQQRSSKQSPAHKKIPPIQKPGLRGIA
jgi:hypothetical protein